MTGPPLTDAPAGGCAGDCDCGCCAGLTSSTPAPIANRAGLPALAYRVGTHAQFKATMLARLSDARLPALARLRTRDDGDFAIALLDAWAALLDVLTFYQERIANEGYLRTATERLSILHLARLIGYELRPGVAAETVLAFTMDEPPPAPPPAPGTPAALPGSTAPVAPRATTIEAGVKVQSVPAPGELPQLFETVETIAARAEWNALRPRLTRPQSVTTTATRLRVRAGPALRAGDEVLVRAGGAAAVRRVARAVPSADGRTVRLDFALGAPPAEPAFAERTSLPEGTPPAAKLPLTEQVVATYLLGRWWSQPALLALAATQGWTVDALGAAIASRLAQTAAPAGTEIYVMRQRAALFGHNAPPYSSLPGTLRLQTGISTYKSDGTFDKTVAVPAAYPAAQSWDGRSVADEAGGTRRVWLDTTYPGITADGWVALRAPGGAAQVYQVQEVAEDTRAKFTLSAKVTRLTLAAPVSFGALTLRDTSVLAQSEPLEPAHVPIGKTVSGSELALGAPYLELRGGQRVVVTGERADLPGVVESETLTLADAVLDDGRTVLVFKTALAHAYVRDTVTVNANAARATHGESTAEVLGGGDARRPFQRFALRQPPLTYLSSADAPGGAASTLEVRVNDLRWREVPFLYGRGPDERVYVTRLNDDGTATVQFGDGRTGARPPSGAENVRARYRKGTGAVGLVRAGQLSLLMTRPPGVRAATNPHPPAGAADPESRDDARRNAPLATLALDRIVSLQDYEDYSRAFSGIAKALATWTWTGERREVFLTVAGAKGAAVAAGDALYANLLAAIAQAGDPTIPVRLATYAPAFFKLSARVRTDADFLRERVLAGVEAALRARFSFDARGFGQAVALSEVVAAMQGVSGVVGVDVDALWRQDQPAVPNAVVPAALPQAGAFTAGAALAGAELLTLDPAPLQFGGMS